MSYYAIYETIWKQSELYAKLQAHEAAQREFINMAAHELRTPIQPILGLSEVLLMKDKNKDLTPYHNIILRNARRLQKLTEDILDVTKIEANAVKLKKETVNLYSLISEVIEDFQHEITHYSQVEEQVEGGARRGQGFRFPSQENVKIILSSETSILQPRGSRQQQYKNKNRGRAVNENQEDKVPSHIQPPPPPPLMVMMDRNRITQVLNNLISNALWSVTCRCNENDNRKVSSAAGEDENIGYIKLSTQKDVQHNNVIVTVRDNGGGISQDIFPKLFTKFSTKDHRGLGLGLYICKGIVEAHGGTIWAENKQDGKANGNRSGSGGGGSGSAAIRFTLPLGQA
jgi:signal transduction histidine kinase